MHHTAHPHHSAPRQRHLGRANLRPPVLAAAGCRRRRAVAPAPALAAPRVLTIAGSLFEIRPIRPQDAALIVAAAAYTSDETYYRRFRVSSAASRPASWRLSRDWLNIGLVVSNSVLAYGTVARSANTSRGTCAEASVVCNSWDCL